MGFFDKKYCDICGDKIGMLGNRKLNDGNLCKNCADKLSPWFEERRHSTVDMIKQQLIYREQNKQKVRNFRITKEFSSDSFHVYIDETKGWFAIAKSINEIINPDILDLSQIINCHMEIGQEKQEERYRDNEGNMRSYTPPRYTYSYNYLMKIAVQSPYFDDMDFKLNSFSVKNEERMKVMQYENLGNQIVMALTGMANQGMNGYGQGMTNQGINGYHQGMQNQGINGYGQGMQNQGINGYHQGMQNQGINGYGQGMTNQGINGYGQGMANQEINRYHQGMQNQSMIRCDKCGWMPENPNYIPKFCPACGDPIDGNDQVM